MNRNSFLGLISLTIWGCITLLLFDTIAEIIEGVLNNFTGLFNSIFTLDLLNAFQYGVTGLILTFIWITWYMCGMGFVLLAMTED